MGVKNSPCDRIIQKLNIISNYHTQQREKGKHTPEVVHAQPTRSLPALALERGGCFLKDSYPSRNQKFLVRYPGEKIYTQKPYKKAYEAVLEKRGLGIRASNVSNPASNATPLFFQ